MVAGASCNRYDIREDITFSLKIHMTSKKLQLVREIKFNEFQYSKDIATEFDGKPILQRLDGTYQIRIVKAYKKRGASVRWEFEYFELDSTGLIIKSPNRLSRNFDDKVRITDIYHTMEVISRNEVEKEKK